MSIFSILAERCKQEIKPNRELDALIAIAMGWLFQGRPLTLSENPHDLSPWFKEVYTHPHWRDKNSKSVSELVGYWYYGNGSILPFFTASEDMARIILPPDVAYMSMIDFELPGRVKLFDGDKTFVTVDANTPVYAMLAACLTFYHLQQEETTDVDQTHILQS